MNILYLSTYSFQGPNSRYRIFQYLPYFGKNRLDVKVSPLFENRYFEILKIKRKPVRIFLKSLYSIGRLAKRLKDLGDLKKFDLVVVERQVFPYLPPVIEFVMKLFGIDFVLEFDDAVYLTFLHRWKLEKLISISKHIIVGNKFLQRYALQFNSNVTIIPTVIDTSRYSKKDYSKVSDTTVIGWIGLAYNLHYLQSLAQVFQKLAQRFNICLKIVGNGYFEIPGVKVIFKKWNHQDEVEDIKSFDIGVMPLEEDEWSMGKCGVKLIQYMGCGVAAVCSPVGVNRDIVTEGMNGFWAKDETEWEDKLSKLCSDVKLREKFGENGMKMVEKYYSLKVWAPKLCNLYKRIGSNVSF